MRVRTSVLLGGAFAALLLVIGISAILLWNSASVAQRRVILLHDAHSRSAGALATVRANAFLAGLLTRDYLLDPDPSHAMRYVEQFDEIRQSTERSFDILQATLQSSAEKSALTKLRSQLEAYWDPTEIALYWTPEEKLAHGRALLRQRVRRREEVFTLTQQIESLLTANFARERQRVTDADRAFRASFAWITGLALVLGCIITALTFSRMIRLERQSAAAEYELRRLSIQLRQAQEHERKHLSRELHDQVGQMLTGLRMELAAMARTGAADTDFPSRITRAKTTVEQTLRIVRNIAMLLRPSMLDDLGLTPALGWQVREFGKTNGVNAKADIDPAVDALPDSYRTCIYRIVQEALTNCARHARAENVTVTVTSSGKQVTTSIVDDGAGFDPGSQARRGLGLLGIEERVRELNGQLKVTSSPGNGTCVEVTLPCPPASEVPDDSNPDRGRSRNRANRIEASV